MIPNRFQADPFQLNGDIFGELIAAIELQSTALTGNQMSVIDDFGFSPGDPPGPIVTPVPIVGSGQTYRQDFDDALGSDGSIVDTPLPQGWLANTDGIERNTISRAFSPDNILPATYNAGAGDDRTLAIGRRASGTVDELGFQLEVTDSDIRAWRVMANVEAWAAGTGASDPFDIGFDVLFSTEDTTLDLGTVSKSLEKPTDGPETRDGNATSNRIAFDSGVFEQLVRAGTTANLRFDAGRTSNSASTIFGLDDVVIRAVAPGDTDANGVVDVADLLTLLGDQKFNQGEVGVTWEQGDFNADDQFNTGDLLAMLAYLAGQFPSEPYASEVGASVDAVPDVIVNSETGEVTVDLAGHTVSAIIIESAGEIFNGEQPDWNATSQFPSTLPGELGNVLFTSTASGVDELGVLISAEFLGRDKEFYLQDLDLSILIVSDGGSLTKGTVIVVPEPSTWMMLLLALVTMAICHRTAISKLVLS